MASPIASFTKTPTEQRWLAIDWSGVILPEGVTIATVTWDSSPAGLTVASGYLLNRVSYVHVSEGSDATTYVVTATLTTSETPPTKIEKGVTVNVAV
jgi:hypothetical protein